MLQHIKSTFYKGGIDVGARNKKKSDDYVKKLNGLHEASRFLVSSTNFKNVLDKCAVISKELVDAQGVTIYLLNQSRTTLEPIISRENYADQILSTPFKVGEGVSGKVAVSGKAEMVNRVDLTDKGKQIPGTPVEPESLISIPIKVRKKVIGVMTVSRLGEKEFIEEDLMLLEHLANISASAIENARLFSKKKLVEQDLMVSKKRADVSDRLKSSFLSAMSHEIRTPLNAMLGFTDLLTSDLKHNLSQKQKEILETITQSGNRLRQFIEDILDISEIEADQMALGLKSFPADILVRKAVKDVKIFAEQKNLELEESYKASDIKIKVDRLRYQQAIGNLLHNAVKYTHIGGISLSTRVTNNQYVVSIVDTGIGIKEDFLPNLFTLFRQEDEGVSRMYEGVGLGLAIAHRLITAMGGSIEVNSEKGKGSTFKVTFPVSKSQAIGEIKEEVHKLNGTINTIPKLTHLPKSGNLTVLIVEDNLPNLNYAKFLLKKLNYEVSTAFSGEQALDLLKKQDVVCMLIDISLVGGMSGTEFLKKIRRRKGFRNIPAIAVTAYAMSGDREKFLNEGFNDYLPKPFMFEDLKKILQRNLIDKYSGYRMENKSKKV